MTSRFRMGLLGVISLLLSAAVSFFAYRSLERRFHPVPEETVRILLATQKLNLGSRITADQIRVVDDWHKADVPEDGYLSNVEDAVGRSVLVPMFPNEPILSSKLAPRESGAGLGSIVRPGMRAVPVRVNDVAGIAGFAVPGTRVDVIVVGAPENGVMTSKIFLENVEVLAAGQNIQPDANGKPQTSQVVTLLLTPEDAQKLALAGDARIQLVLRNPADTAIENPRGVQSQSLYGSQRSAEAPKQTDSVIRFQPKSKVKLVPVGSPPQTVTVEVINGTERKNVTYVLKPH